MANILVFGQDVFRPTQLPNGSYSHANRQAWDFGGKNYGGSGSVDKWFGNRVSMQVTMVQPASEHAIIAVTTEPVLLPTGDIDYVSLLFCHRDTQPNKVGDILKPDAVWYTEGTYSGGKKGAVSAHMHVQAARGKQSTWVKNSKGAWVMPNEARLQDVMFLPDNIPVYTFSGYNPTDWKRVSEAGVSTSQGSEADMKLKIYKAVDKTDSSQLVGKEGWILDGAGNFYNPNGDSVWAAEFTDSTLSTTYERAKKELKDCGPGFILKASED